MCIRVLLIAFTLSIVTLVTAESRCPLGARFERGPATFGCPPESAPVNGYCCQLLSEAAPVCAGGVTYERGIPVNGSCPPGAMLTYGDTPYSACCQAPEPGNRCPGGGRFERGPFGGFCPPEAEHVNGFCCTFQPKESVCPGGAYHELGSAKDGRCPPGFDVVAGYCCQTTLSACPKGRWASGPAIRIPGGSPHCPSGQISVGDYCCK